MNYLNDPLLDIISHISLFYHHPYCLSFKSTPDWLHQSRKASEHPPKGPKLKTNKILKSIQISIFLFCVLSKIQHYKTFHLDEHYNWQKIHHKYKVFMLSVILTLTEKSFIAFNLHMYTKIEQYVSAFIEWTVSSEKKNYKGL